MQESLSEKLKEAGKVFDFKRILSQKTEEGAIKKYYKINQFAYSFFQSPKGFFHLGISEDGILKEDDLLWQPKVILQLVKKYGAKNILELACGRGSNSSFLASQIPKAKFYAMDFSPSQLAYAKKASKTFKNFIPILGNYSDLVNFDNNCFDIIFVIEGLCHSTTKLKDFAGFKRVLKNGGRLVVFDGYRLKTEHEMSTDERLAVCATEKGMALSKFDTYNDFKLAAKSSGLELESERDLSSLVMPNLCKLESYSKKFFNHPRKAKILSFFLPNTFLFNAVSAYFMPTLLNMKCFCYMETIFKKKEF